MTKVYPGFGETMPDSKVERQIALQRMMKRQAEHEQALNEKIIKELYVEPKGGAETGATESR